MNEILALQGLVDLSRCAAVCQQYHNKTFARVPVKNLQTYRRMHRSYGFHSKDQTFFNIFEVAMISSWHIYLVQQNRNAV